jgi:hypothetical protein
LFWGGGWVWPPPPTPTPTQTPTPTPQFIEYNYTNKYLNKRSSEIILINILIIDVKVRETRSSTKTHSYAELLEQSSCLRRRYLDRSTQRSPGNRVLRMAQGRVRPTANRKRKTIVCPFRNFERQHQRI